MKRMIMIPALGLLFVLAACGSQTVVSSVSVEEPAAFGVSVVGETEAVPSPETPSPTEQTSEPSPEQAPAEAVDPELAVRAAVYAAYLDGMDYDRENPIFFWRAEACLVTLLEDPALVGEDGLLYLPAAALEPYVYALFGDYGEQYPSVGEENPFVAEVYRDGTEYLAFTPRDLSGLTVETRMNETSVPGMIDCTARVLADGVKLNEYWIVLRQDDRGAYIESMTDQFTE